MTTGRLALTERWELGEVIKSYCGATELQADMISMKKLDI